MLTPGHNLLGQFAITDAGTYYSEPVICLDGMASASIEARLAYGSGGTTVKFYLQTSIDGGTTWVDIICIAFTTESLARVTNITTALGADVRPTDATLSDDTIVNGILGNRLRVKYVVTGTYAGATVLVVDAVVR